MNTLDSAEENTRTIDIQYKKYDHISHVETPTISYTATPTPTFSDTPTVSYTETSTPTITYTPTVTFSDTPTVSYTETSTPTITYTPTATFSDTPTVSYTETSTPTITYTPTATFSDTPTVSYTETSTPTITYTPTVSYTETSTPTTTNTESSTLSSIKLIQKSKREYLEFSFSGSMEESSGIIHNNSMYISASTNNTIEYNSYPTSITLTRWTSSGGWNRWWASDCGRFPSASSCSPWMAFKAWVYKSEDQGLTWTQVWHGSSASHPNTWETGNWFHAPNVTLTFANGEWYRFETSGDPGHGLMSASYAGRAGALPSY